jgi:DNA-binding beta-propeller fold protein YncE
MHPSNIYDFTKKISNIVKSINEEQHRSKNIGFDVLIAVIYDSKLKLKYIDDYGSSEDISNYKAIGSGEPYGSFFLKKFWNEEMNLIQASEIGFRIIKFIEKNDLDISVGSGNLQPQIIFVIKNEGIKRASIQFIRKLNEKCQNWLNDYLSNTFLNYKSIIGTDEYIPLMSIGSKGNNILQFVYPEGIVVDSNSNVYVADQENNNIQKLDTDGKFITLWGNREDKIFSHSYALAIDSKNDIYVTDSDSIKKFNSDGTLIYWDLEKFDFSSPHGIAIDREDNVFVSDEIKNEIRKYNQNGSLVCKWGSYGNLNSNINCNLNSLGAIEKGDGQFDHPLGLTVDSHGNVYVSDSLNDRIQKFDNNGRFIQKWGIHGNKEGEFYYPFGLSIIDIDDIIVVDHKNDRIQKFSQNGHFKSCFGNRGNDLNQFNGPRFICVDERKKKIYITDGGNHRIVVVSTTWEGIETLDYFKD